MLLGRRYGPKGKKPPLELRTVRWPSWMLLPSGDAEATEAWREDGQYYALSTADLGDPRGSWREPNAANDDAVPWCGWRRVQREKRFLRLLGAHKDCGEFDGTIESARECLESEDIDWTPDVAATVIELVADRRL